MMVYVLVERYFYRDNLYKVVDVYSDKAAAERETVRRNKHRSFYYAYFIIEKEVKT